ncbi:MAG: type II toxin-antitoxin system RelE/ParE family toxin [Ignavibacteriales bacterium]|nr:type II toxin-antitoxin system RelE/ParE family toxin [Ignavibacteriales bacterium]
MVQITRRAKKDLDHLQKAQPELFDKLVAKVQSMENNPRSGKPLIGVLKGKWSPRVGDYRVMYQIQKSEVIVLTINHRKEVYR